MLFAPMTPFIANIDASKSTIRNATENRDMPGKSDRKSRPTAKNEKNVAELVRKKTITRIGFVCKIRCMSKRPTSAVR